MFFILIVLKAEKHARKMIKQLTNFVHYLISFLETELTVISRRGQ